MPRYPRAKVVTRRRWIFVLAAVGSSLALTMPAHAKRFGRDGTIKLPPGESAALVALPNGNLIVAGTGDCGERGRDFVVRRLHRNGSIDRSFGRQGVACHDVGRLIGERLRAAVRRPNGEIVLVGHRRSGDRRDGLVMSLEQHGRLDRGFGTQGRSLIDVAARETIKSVDVARRGRLLLGGDGFSPDYIARLRRSGQIDRDWPASRRPPIPWVLRVGGEKLDVLADRRILSLASRDFSVSRLQPGGRRDRSFGNDGVAAIVEPGIPLAEDMEVERDGDIAVTGKVFGGGPGRPFLTARYRPDGGLDTSFGQNGRQTTSFVADPDDACNESARPQTLTRVAGGKLLVAGVVRKPLRIGCELVVGLVRYRPDGSPDPSFDDDGRMVIRKSRTTPSDPIALEVQRRTGNYLVASGNGRIVRLDPG